MFYHELIDYFKEYCKFDRIEDSSCFSNLRKPALFANILKLRFSLFLLHQKLACTRFCRDFHIDLTIHLMVNLFSTFAICEDLLFYNSAIKRYVQSSSSIIVVKQNILNVMVCLRFYLHSLQQINNCNFIKCIWIFSRIRKIDSEIFSDFANAILFYQVIFL